MSRGAPKSFFWEQLPSEKLWYLVGLITSDGCLSSDGRHIDITAKEEDFVKMLKCEMGLRCAIGQKRSGGGYQSFHMQIGSRSFYLFLVSLGLTPRKSKTLGSVQVPKMWFAHFLRGVMDGDGCVRSWQGPKTKQWYCKITSGSRNFLEWLQQTLQDYFSIRGTIHSNYCPGDVGILKISSRQSVRRFLEVCYDNSDIALPRKRAQARQYFAELPGW